MLVVRPYLNVEAMYDELNWPLAQKLTVKAVAPFWEEQFEEVQVEGVFVSSQYIGEHCDREMKTASAAMTKKSASDTAVQYLE